MEEKMERRSFLKGLAITGLTAAGAGIIAGCSPKVSDQATTAGLPESWDKEADVVVVGGGGTGIVAALEAAAAGSSVIVLEKAINPGGNTALSSGVIQAAGTKFQKEFTKYQDDTPEKHFEYWKSAAEEIIDENLVKSMADGAPDCIDWLVNQGIEYINVYGVAVIPTVDSQYMADRIHVPGGGENGTSGWGKYHVDTLLANAKNAGVEFLTETPAKQLIVNGDEGVVGLIAENGGKSLTIKAKKGVIMASGGYDHNIEMSRTFSPHQLWALETGVSYAAPTNEGDGIRMGMEIGADLACLGGTIGLPTTNVGIAPTLPGNLVVPGLMVNKQGLRFVAEDNHYGWVMRVVFNQEAHLAWQIWDQKAMDMGGAAVSGISAMSEDMQQEISDGKVIKADSLAELAAAIGVNATNLERTFAAWNEDMHADGKDSAWGKIYGLEPIETAPYYAVKVIEYNLGTIGGLRINGNAQVLDLNGNVIPRLYAGGQTAGGHMGPYYPGTGTGVISTVYFGRIAGKGAAAETAWS
jgi:fumarate reductase flavoprotein subunit